MATRRYASRSEHGRQSGEPIGFGLMGLRVLLNYRAESQLARYRPGQLLMATSTMGT